MRMTKDGKLRIGLMGCGVVADYGHIPAILYTPGLELTAVFDIYSESAERTAKKYETQAFCNVEEFFALGFDAVVIASSAGAHKENLFAAAEHGMAVLCEKPLAITDEDAQSMVDEMCRRDLPFYAGFVYRASPVAQQIKRWVEEGIAGEIRSVRLPYLWNLHGQWEQLPNGKWQESPRWRGRMLEGGPLVDCGVHQIDLALWWLNSEVIDWQVAAAWVSNYEAPDHVYLHMDHASGAHTAVEMSFTYGHTSREPLSIFEYELIGTGGTLRYNREGWVLEARNGKETIRVPGESEKNFAEMYKAFDHALRTGEPGLLASGPDGVVATKIARAATNLAIQRRNRLFPDQGYFSQNAMSEHSQRRIG